MAEDISSCFRRRKFALADRNLEVQKFRKRAYFDQSSADRVDRAMLNRRNFLLERGMEPINAVLYVRYRAKENLSNRVTCDH